MMSLLNQVVAVGLSSALLLTPAPPAPPIHHVSNALLPVASTSLEFRPTGIDVASHQHPNDIKINYDKVRSAGVRFVLVKATEGMTYFNDHYIEDRSAATAAGLVTGSYHYARPEKDMTSASEQAKQFAAVTLSSRLPGDLPPILDIEEDGGLTVSELNQWVTAFIATLETLAGRKPIIYTYPSFWMYNMGNTTRFSHYPLWIADYNGKRLPTTPLPGGWKDYAFWQHSSTGHIDGVPAVVDLNVFNGSLIDLEKMRYRG